MAASGMFWSMAAPRVNSPANDGEQLLAEIALDEAHDWQ
jgi:hypothetical protein